jgi:uncharacterized protein YjeT (DUF2065 family)
MHSYARFAGVVLIAIGVFYIIKPDAFKRGVWKKTDAAQRLLSPQGYIKYMRAAGLVNIIIGVILFVWSWTKS